MYGWNNAYLNYDNIKPELYSSDESSLGSWNWQSSSIFRILSIPNFKSELLVTFVSRDWILDFSCYFMTIIIYYIKLFINLLHIWIIYNETYIYNNTLYIMYISMIYIIIYLYHHTIINFTILSLLYYTIQYYHNIYIR